MSTCVLTPIIALKLIQVMAKLVHVAVGVIQNPRGEIFIAQRAAKAHQGGLWEFPGGKLEAGETTPQALTRELREELAIEVETCAPLIQIRHDYPDKSVLLDVYRVTQFRGEPVGNEGQPVRWVTPAQLSHFEFPAANRPIIKAITLEERMAISGAFAAADDLLVAMQRLRNWGLGQLILRTDNKSRFVDTQFMAKVMQGAADLRLQLQLNTSPQNFFLWQAQQSEDISASLLGLHLSARELALVDARPIASELLLGASCHNLDELQQAARVGVDYALLSPVAATATHPQAKPLGWEAFARLVATVNFPVYALGGMTDADLHQAQALGGQGVAAISAWWQR